MQRTTAAKYSGSCSRDDVNLRNARRGEALEGAGGSKQHTVIIVTGLLEIVLELGEDVGESHDGILLGGVRRAQVDGLGGGLLVD